MRTQNRTKFFAIVTTLFALAASWTLWGATRVDAVQDNSPRPRVCGGSSLLPDPFGVASNQTARVNVANPAAEVMIIVPCIFDADGNLLKDFGRATVAPGHTMSFDLDADSLVPPRDRFGRIQMRVVVTTEEGGPEPHLSVEVIDNATGKTTVFIGNAGPSFNAIPRRTPVCADDRMEQTARGGRVRQVVCSRL